MLRWETTLQWLVVILLVIDNSLFRRLQHDARFDTDVSFFSVTLAFATDWRVHLFYFRIIVVCNQFLHHCCMWFTFPNSLSMALEMARFCYVSVGFCSQKYNWANFFASICIALNVKFWIPAFFKPFATSCSTLTISLTLSAFSASITPKSPEPS